MVANANGIGRVLPHNLEAEEYLLSSCMIGGRDVVARCQQEGLRPLHMYDPKHEKVLGILYDLYQRGEDTATELVALELANRKELELIGGTPFLMQVSNLVATTARVGAFIAAVKSAAVLRNAIRIGTSMIEEAYGYSGDVDEFAASVRARAEAIEIGGAPQHVKSLADFALPPEDDPTALLGRHRYICRGDACLLVSSSGMGKSVMNYQWAAMGALGRPFLGIATKKRWKSLIVQSEDSEGDIGEVWFSVKTALNLTDAEMAQVHANVIVVTERVRRGDEFIARLKALVDKYQPDLVWLNPLHAFAGCDITDATALGRFLRGGLNNINREGKFAYMIVHHTPKPVTGKNVGDKKWHDFMYDAAGSAELVNYVRVVITLKPTENEGEFNLILAKRGTRAGVLVEVADAAVKRFEVTTKVPCRHSTTHVNVPGRNEPFKVVYWIGRDADPVDEVKTKKGRPPNWSAEQLIRYFPASNEEPITRPALARAIAAGDVIDRSTLTRALEDMKRGRLLIQQSRDGRWKRTAHGDAYWEGVAKGIP